jgi:hypothetical protein
VMVRAFVDKGVSARLTLMNEPVGDATDSLQVREVSLNFDVSEHKPRAHFIAASLYAALGLGGPIKISIPEMGLDVGVRFDMPLQEISTLLQSRQTYFGLLVIERATGLELEIPEHITPEDMNAIAFTYHAIVEREFDWLANEVTAQMPATEQYLIWANNPRSTQVNEFSFGPTPASRSIFGQKVELGPETVFIKDGVIRDIEHVRGEFARLDGHMVSVVVRPLSRIGRFSLPLAPRLPSAPWGEKIGSLIALEDSLNERLAIRYHDLAASTLSDLSPEEVQSVTARPDLGEDAHLIND